MDVQIVLPDRADDDLSDRLRALTAAISIATGEDSGFGMGGENGYGENYENDVFMMHRFCWCGGEDCPWCSYSDEDGAHFQEKNRKHGAINGLDCGQAPNFWHKPSGLRVIWYKWIGRDNAVHLPEGVDLDRVFAECLASLPSTTTGEVS